MVKLRYLFSPRKRRTDNKSMFFSKEHRDLKPQPPLPFSCICDCSWMHKWAHNAPQKATQQAEESFFTPKQRREPNSNKTLG